MKKRIIFLMVMILVYSIGINRVLADSPECQAELGNYSTKAAVGDEFIYDVGTMGAASNAYVSEIYYIIQYNREDLEVVNVAGKVATAYNGWNIEAGNNTNTGLLYNEIVIHAYTEDKSKMYISSSDFVKIAYVKFKVKSTASKSTSIELIKDDSYYVNTFEDDDSYERTCDNTVITVVNIYSKDSNASLSSLKVNNGELNPKFNANTTSYSVVVDNNVDTIQIDGTCSGANCKLTGTGLKKLDVGENKYAITVTSEKGTTKDYTLTVTRREKDEAYLQKLLIKDVDLYPEFNSGVTNYVVNVPNEVNKLDIEYTTNNDTVNKVDIIGNEDLKVGKNYITITVKNEDKRIEQTYQILVNKDAPVAVKEEKTTPKINIYEILTFVLAGVSIIELIVILILYKSKKVQQ